MQKLVWKVEIELLLILTLALDGSACSDCGPNCLTLWENYWHLSNGRLASPQNRPGLFVQDKNLLKLPGIDP